MKEYIIKKNESGQRLDKYLKKLLPNASMGFIYKMLRKKNITCNGQKADGTEILSIDDHVKLFFSDETFDKFSGNTAVTSSQFDNLKALKYKSLQIIYENEDYILINKPVNMLSQKAKESDVSANELLISYMINTGSLTEEEYRTFHPSVCNRLDQNTTGLLVFGKTLKGLQEMAKGLKDRSAHKYYLAIVTGKAKPQFELKGYLKKDASNNKVSLSTTQIEDSVYVETRFKSLSYNTNENISLLEIELITGKTHQIRAHLASCNHAIIGDYKYGNRRTNDYFKLKYGVNSQLLHAKKLIIPQIGTFTADEPIIFSQLINQ